MEMFGKRRELHLTRWLQHVQKSWGDGPHINTLRGLLDSLRGLWDQSVEPADVAQRFGIECGERGHSLGDATAWFSALTEQMPRQRRAQVDRWQVAVRLSEGWMQGVERAERDHGGAMSTVEVLRLRINQQYDRCSALGLDAAAEHTLAIIDARPDAGKGSVELARRMQDLAFEYFAAGETVAVDQLRLIVLTPRTPELATTVRALVDELSGLTRAASFHGWIEPLPTDRRHVGELINELAPGLTSRAA